MLKIIGCVGRLRNGCREMESVFFSCGGVKLCNFYGEWINMGGEVETKILSLEPKMG